MSPAAAGPYSSGALNSTARYPGLVDGLRAAPPGIQLPQELLGQAGHLHSLHTLHSPGPTQKLHSLAQQREAFSRREEEEWRNKRRKC